MSGRGGLIDVNGILVHETAVVDTPSAIGRKTRIWHFTHVMAGATIGRECTLGQGVFVGQGVVIGDGVKIQNNVSIFDGVTIDDEVFLGPSVVFTNVSHPRAHISKRDCFEKTRVRKGATLGANVTVVCGCDIGPYAFVGAGAVVTRTVPAHALVVGNPAVLTGWVCRCGERLTEPQLVCPACRERYRKDGADLCRKERP